MWATYIQQTRIPRKNVRPNAEERLIFSNYCGKSNTNKDQLDRLLRVEAKIFIESKRKFFR